jgi:damage-control phosphatase, subfamily I
MKTTYDCIPCFIRQALDAVRLATSDEKIHEQVLRGVLAAASKMNLDQSPPVMGQYIHRLIRELSGHDDPYKKIKDRFNSFALKLYPDLKQRIESSSNPMDTAVRMAIAGNIIDFGVNSELDQSVISDTIEQALSAQLFGNIEVLCDSIDSAENILYLGDNCGEIVFDRLLIEQLPVDKVTFVVRGGPIINDATMTDALETGMTELINVIDNGSNVPGTVLEKCSKEFRECFAHADLIIAKGQGNYETLSSCEKNIFFLLKAKCPVISGHVGCEPGSFIVKRSS